MSVATKWSANIGMPVPSVANTRVHWRKRAKIAKAQRLGTLAALASKYTASPRIGETEPGLTVWLTRVSARTLDTDNLASALKAVRDGVADWIGTDDSPGNGIEWEYRQHKRMGYQGVEIWIARREFLVVGDAGDSRVGEPETGSPST